MKLKIIIGLIAYFASFVFSLSQANEVNIFSADIMTLMFSYMKNLQIKLE